MKKLLTSALLALLVLSSIADAQTPLRQSTSRVVRICGAVAVGDGFTPVTTLALGSADEAEALRDNTATLDISGATFAAITGADGCYSLTLDTTATNTVGELIVVIQDDSLILPIRRTFQVYEEAVYDRDFAASATGIIGTAQTGDAFARLGAPAGASVSADIVVLDNFVDDLETRLTATRAGYLDNLNGHTAQTGDTYARLGAPVGASISADLQVVDTNVDDIETDTADMQPKLGTFSNLGSGATLSGNLEDMRDNGTAAFDRSTDSLQAIRDRGDSAWITGAGGTGLTALADGTAQGGTSSTIQLASAETFANDILNGAVVNILTGTGAGQSRVIIDYVGSTDTATVTPNWTTNPSSDSTYEVVPGTVNVTAWLLEAVTAIEDSSDIATAVATELGNGSAFTEAGGTGDQFTAQPWNASWDAEVQSEATDALNAYDPPTRTELTNDINSLNDLDAAGVRAAVGLASANLDTQLSTIDTNVDDIEADTADMQPKLGTFSDLGSGATLSGNLEDMRDNGTAAFDRTTDSLQAVRDRGDAAWTTGAGGTPPQLLQSTTIATLATQTSFTLTAGSADNDAYNGAIAIITDQSTATQKAVGEISDYVGSTRTVTLVADPAIFTMAVGDSISILAAISNAPTAAAVRAEIDANSTQLAAIVADTNELQTDDVPGLLAALNDLDAAGVRTAVGLATANLDTQLSTIDGNVDDIETAVGALNDLDAAGVRAAVGLASANLDTQLSTIDTNVDDIETDTADMQPKLGTPAGASLAADIAALPTAAEIWQVQCEDQGGGYSCQEVMSLLLSEAIGRCTYTAGTRQFVCSDPSGTETRFTLVYGTDLDGDRTSSTPAPATF